MKSFEQYISEANPVVDQKARSLAARVYNRMISRLRECLAKGTIGTSFVFYTANDNVGFNLGRLLREPDYFDITIWFGPMTNKFGGYFSQRDDMDIIHLAKLFPTSAKKIKPNRDMKNCEIILDAVDKLQHDVRDVFVHEFIHHLDDTRYKSNSYRVKGTLDLSGGTYYNEPKELNAHTQEMIANMDLWFKDYYVSTVNALKTRMVVEFNQAKDEEGYENALFIAGKIVRHYALIVEYLDDTRKGMESIIEKIPGSKRDFMKHLTSENRKKVLARLYQYYTETLNKRFKVLKESLLSVVKRLNNKNAIAYIQKEVPDTYKSLVQMGLK
jgi:hypothetical protein